MESQLSSDLTERRREIERDFTKVTSIPSSVADRGRILTLASSGDFGIAKSVLYEQMKSNQQDEELLETMALLETYDLRADLPEYWLDTLLRNFPDNDIGNKIRMIRIAEDSKEWGAAYEKSTDILEQDGQNWFALLIAAKSQAALGKWEASSDYWDKIGKLIHLSPEEVFDSSRSYYNSKRFHSVIELNSRYSDRGVFHEKILELMVKSHYNLHSNDLCIDLSKQLLEINPESKVGLRYQSRSLVRLGKISESIPAMRKYCQIYPTSVNAWESLLEAHLMMDRNEEVREIWNLLKRKIDNSVENFLTAIEIALKFHWREEYRKIIQENSKRYTEEPGFSDRLAEIHLNLGDIGGAWEVLNSHGQDPMKSFLNERFLDIINKTNTTTEELQKRADLGQQVWINELVTRELLRKSVKKRTIGRRPIKCHLISSSLDRGGAERQVAMTLKHMKREEEFQCSLAVHRMENIRGAGTYLDDLAGMEDHIYNLDGIEFDNDGLSGREILIQNEELLGLLDSGVRKKIRQLIVHFSEKEPDLVHAWQDETILTCAIAGALTGVPRILGSARSLRPDEKTELHIRKRPYLKNCFMEIFSRKENFLSTNSIAGMKSYSEWIGIEESEIEVNHNGVDFKEIESRMESKSIRKTIKQFGFTRENRIVGGLFRLEPGKRPELWIEAFEYAKKRDDSLRGIIVGGGRMESSLRDWIRESGLDGIVKIIGEVEDVGGWLSEMDIFLFTSISEGLPNVVIEAQGFGVPVVSTSVGGIPEIVTDGETGILVNSSSSEQLGREIVKIMSRGSFSRMGEKAKFESRERFAVSKMISRTCEMYSRVVAEQ